MTTKKAAAPAVPAESKKEALMEIFRAAVWSDLVPGGRQEIKQAIEAGKKQGVTDYDIEWLDRLDGKSFRAYFGEKAISKDLENAMKLADAFLEGMQYKPNYKADGFYGAKP